jgi:hypothetical protein
MKIEVGVGRITKKGVLIVSPPRKENVVKKYFLVVKSGDEIAEYQFDAILKVQKFMMKKGYLPSKEPKEPKPTVELFVNMGRLL